MTDPLAAPGKVAALPYVFWLLNPDIMASLPVSQRLAYYRRAIKHGAFPDLATAHRDFARRYARWCRAEVAGQPQARWLRLDQRAGKRYRMLVATIPPGPCTYCGVPDARHIDHVIPRAQGGTNDLKNLTRACRPCNSQKRALTPGEWKARRLAKGLPWPPLPSRPSPQSS